MTSASKQERKYKFCQDLGEISVVEAKILSMLSVVPYFRDIFSLQYIVKLLNVLKTADFAKIKKYISSVFFGNKLPIFFLVFGKF